MIPKHIVDEIMTVTRIEEVIGDFVALKKAGSDLKALSPFSHEKTPSFYVSPNKQIFKDFSSGKGGNAVTFLMEHEQISYPEALRYLAKKYGITIPEEKEVSQEELLQANEKESLHIVLEYAGEFFKKLLNEDPDGKAVGRTYFYERGFRDDTIEKFGLGYSKEAWDLLYQTAVKAGYKEEYLLKAGLIKQNEAGKTYDMFRNRVIFPIHNLVGKVVAFAGRQLSKEDKGPKYLNSPESPVYHKSDILYALNFAKNSIRLNDKCYLVEGYTDVITLHQASIENVVASSGTSLTEGQIRQIKRFTPNITVLYDGDPAGLKASQRGIDLILQQGMNVRLVIFPDGEDPDSYCKNVGGDAFREYINQHEQDFILFKSQFLMGESGNDPLRKAEAVRSIVESIALIPDPLKRSVFATQCAKIMEISEPVIMAELNKLRKKNAEKEFKSVSEPEQLEKQVDEEKPLLPSTGTETQEKAICRNLVRYGSLPYDETHSVASYILSEIGEGMEFSHPLCVRIYDIVKSAAEQEQEISEAFFTLHSDNDINSFAADALVRKYGVSADWVEKHEIEVLSEEDNYRNEVFSSLLYYKIRRLELHIESNAEELKQALASETADEEKVTYLMQKDVHLKSVRKELSGLIGTVVLK